MNEDYLWDRSGKPDADIARLEEQLGQFRLPTPRPTPRPVPRQRGRWFIIPIAIAAAAAIAALLLPSHRTTDWNVVAGGLAPRALRTGEVVETGPTARATISSDAVGEVDIDPSSRLRISTSRKPQQRFDLEQGVIHARIWAPPAEFIVDTPGAEAVDLGCSYTLEVAPNGAGRVVVETGWVAFKWRQRESFIPAEASCAVHPGKGPGTPYFLDAPIALRQALIQFDADGSEAALDTMLRTARARDALTLWHLLGRTEGLQRANVLHHFAALTKFPYAGNEAAILSGKPAAFDSAWNSMKLGDAGFWRQWEQRLP